MKIHQPHEQTPGTKEALCTMKCQLAQIVRRSIEAHVVGDTWLVTGVVKRGTQLKNVQIKIEHKELERQCQSQSNNLQLEGNTLATPSMVPGILPNWGQPAHILIDTHIFPPSLEDIYVVQDFSDVFSDELPDSLVDRKLN